MQASSETPSSSTTAATKKEPAALTPMELKLQKYLLGSFKIHVSKFDIYNQHIDSITTKKAGKQVEEIDDAMLRKFIYATPIEELGIEKSSMDDNVINNVLRDPLFVEIKELRNVSQPFQRVGEKISSKDDEEKEKKKLRKLKNQTYQFKAHDGQRLIKVIMLFPDQDRLVRSIFESNKFLLTDAYLTPTEPNTFVIDHEEQIVELHSDKRTPPIQEEYQMMQGLPLKYTNAPRFVFLNEQAGEAGEQKQKEQDDEFADIFRTFDVPDLTSSERTYIKRFEQLGFWRKKFPPGAAAPVNQEVEEEYKE